MELGEIQGNLQGIAKGIPLLDAVKDLILVDDGLQNPLMERALNQMGFVMLIIAPQGIKLGSITPGGPTGGGGTSGYGSAVIEYLSTIWVRTNPRPPITAGKKPFDPLAIEQAILSAVMKWSKGRTDHGFHFIPGHEPESDFTDLGNVSRLIRLAARVGFK